ncbi:MAG: hypothetical protein LR001_01730 [Clostridiales bacterium]|nr:hypothetical protein [Clostridiales bacterium]
MTKIINGSKDEIHLCETCARERKDEDFEAAFDIPKLLASLLDMNIDKQQNQPSVASPKCQNCGMTYSDFRRTGKLGCGRCYDAFRNNILPLIKRIHGNTRHEGKLPKRSGGVINRKRELKRKRSVLKQMIIEEKFEKAAILRDEIKKIEEDINENRR